MFKPKPLKLVFYKFVFRTLSTRMDLFKAALYRVSQVRAAVTFRSLRLLISLSMLALMVWLPLHKTTPVSAATPTLNFQARLENSTGGIATDGDYNVEFKLYNVTTGGTALWTETRTSTNKVRVANGYLTVNLGSVTNFPGTINWDDDLYLTMNIGGTGSPSWDGEMSPRLKLTSVPYAFQAQSATQLEVSQGSYTGQVLFPTLTDNRKYILPDTSLATTASPATICVFNGATSNCPAATGSAYYIHNDTGLQTSANFNIQGADDTTNGTVVGVLRGAAAGQTVDLLQLQASNGTVLTAFTAAGNLKVASSVDTYTATTLSVGTANATAITIAQAGVATTVAGSLTVNQGTTLTGGATIRGLTVDTATATDDLITMSVTPGGAARFTGTLTIADLDANHTWTLPNEDGVICTDAATSVCNSLGSYIQNQNTSAQTTANYWISGTGQADGGFLAPSIDVASAGTLSIGTSTATAITIGQSGVTTTNAGALTVTELLTGNAGATISGGAIALTGNAASSFTTTSGALTLTSATAATWSTTAGDLTLQAGSGTVSLGTSTTLTASGVLGITSGGDSNLGLDTGAAGVSVINLGGTNASQVNIGHSAIITNIQGSTQVALSATTGSTLVCQNASSILASCDSAILLPTASNFIQNQNTSAQTTANYWISGTGQADGGFLAPSIDVASAGTLSIGTSTATAITIGQSGVTTTNAGALTVTELLTGNAGATISGGAVALTGNAASSLTTTSGALTLTSATAATWSTTAGNLTLQAGSGTVSLGTSTTLTASGALSVTSGGATALGLDTGGGAAINIGGTNATSIILGRSGAGTVRIGQNGGTVQIDGTNFDVATTGIMTLLGGVAGGDILTQGTNALGIDTGGAAAINIGATNSNAINIGRASGGGAVTITANAASTWKTTSGNLSLQAGGTLELLSSTNITGNLAVTGTGSFTGGSVTVSTTTATDDTLKLQVTSYAGSTFQGTITNASLTAARTWTLPDTSGTVCVQVTSTTTTNCDFSGTGGYVQFAPSTAQVDGGTNNSIFINKTGASGNILELQKSGVDVFTIGNTGNITATGTYNTNTFTGSALTFGSAATATIQSASGQALNVTGHASSTFSTDAGALTLTSATAATWSTTAGNLTLQAGSGTVSLGTSTLLTASGALSINSGGANTLTLDTGGAAAINVGTANATNITIGHNAGTFAVDGTNFDLSTAGTLTLVGGQTNDITTQANQNLTLQANGTGTLVLNDTTTANGTLTFSGVTTDITTGTNEDLTIDANGTGKTILSDNVDISSSTSLATRVGATFTTAGTSNNAGLNGAGFYLLDTSGAAQVINGITAGRDGQQLTITNVDTSLSVTLTNNSGSATGSKIITGSAVDVIIPVGGTASLVYDSANSVWRVVSGGAGSGVELQSATPGTAQTGNFNISGTGIAGTALQAPIFDTATAVALGIGTANATNITIGHNAGTFAVDGTNFDLSTAGRVTLLGAVAGGDILTQGTNALGIDTGGAAGITIGAANANAVSISRTGVTTTVNGALTVTQLLTGNAGATISGGAIALTGNSGSSFTTSSGALTITSAAAATWSTSAGNLSIQAAGTSNLNLNTGGAGTVNLGSTNTATVNIGSTGATTSVVLQAGSASGNGVAVQSSSATAFRVQNSGSSFTILTADLSAKRLTVGATATPNGSTSANGDLMVVGNSEFQGLLYIGNSSSNAVYTSSAGGPLRFKGTARNSVTVRLVPEYAGAVMTGDGSSNAGTMTSDFCSGSSYLGVPASSNPCGATEEHNYYSWTTSQASAQDYDIYVRWNVPSNYDSADGLPTISFYGWRTNTTNDSLTMSVISGATTCGTATAVGGSNGAWSQQTYNNTGGSCTITPGTTVLTLRLHMSANTSDFVRAGEVGITYNTLF